MNNKLKNKELGKGIEALIKTYSSKNADSILNVTLDRIIPNANNPREVFDEIEMQCEDHR